MLLREVALGGSVSGATLRSWWLMAEGDEKEPALLTALQGCWSSRFQIDWFETEDRDWDYIVLLGVGGTFRLEAESLPIGEPSV